MKTKMLLVTFFVLFFANNILSQTVFVTKTGKKYHTENCRYLRSSSSSIKLKDAKNSGYEPCSACKPKTEVSGSENNKSESSVEESAQIENTSTPATTSKSVQCSATTKSGKRCSRTTTSSNGKCWQHGE